MIKIIDITSEELKRWVDSNYSEECLEKIFLNYIDRETMDRIDRIDLIERIDHSLGLRFTLYLEEKEKENEKI